jgi:hypothetical protein
VKRHLFILAEVKNTSAKSYERDLQRTELPSRSRATEIEYHCNPYESWSYFQEHIIRPAPEIAVPSPV